MNLSLFTKKQSPVFLSLVISERSLAVALWNITNGTPTVVTYSSIVEWDPAKEETLSQATDTAISSLGKDAENAKQVLFGLPERWVSGQMIAKERKHLLRSITQNLELESVGFVVTTEAIVAHLKSTHDTNVNGIYVWLEKSMMTMSSVKRGNVEDISSVGRSDQIVADVIEGATRFTQKQVPPHISLMSLDIDMEELAKYQQELVSFQWSDVLFEHLPTVDVIATETILDAVSLTGGKEVAKSLGLFDERASTGPAVPIGETHSHEPTVAPSFQPVAVEGEELHDEPDIDTQPKRLRGFSPPSLQTNKKILIAFGLVCLLLFAGVGIVMAMASKATASVRVIVRSQEFSLPVSLTIDAKASDSDPSKDILKGYIKTQNVTGSKEIPTSGKKTVGEKATGSITILNKTSQPKLFKSGTLLKEGSKRNFITIEDVTVASASAGSDSTIWGKANVKATAEKIGEEGNADKNIELTIASFDASAFIARTETVFAGGSSRQASAVTEKDHTDLTTAVTADLKNKALEQLKTTIESGEQLVVSDSFAGQKKTFSEPVGKETESVSLSMTASASALVYKTRDLAEFATMKMQDQLPASATLKAEQIQLEIAQTKTINASTVSLTGTITGDYDSVISTEQIAKLLSGKTLEEARQFLDTQGSIASYDIEMKPAFLAPILSTLPKNAENILVLSSVE